jgi:hypothetical protein
MRIIWALIALLVVTNCWAQEMKVEVSPARPVTGEVFQVIFRIFTDADQEPQITFSPSGAEVVGKANQGISTRTIYANGKLTVTREVTVVYDLMASRVGTTFLRDIKADLGDQTIKHPVVAVNVIREREEIPDIFVMSDVPKKNLYVGEGVIARYYLYSKVPVSSVDVKGYPKLNNFLKRFLQEPDRSERVAVDGQIYLRTQIYAAKLFPEKPGELKVDSLELSATYPSVRAGDPFGAFGMNRNYKTKTISSETVKVQVLPLPQPIPANFTGLVGKHDIQLQFGQSKLIVNEPLEVKLTVTGAGGLENLEAPDFLKHQALEAFESNGDLKISNADEATKVFDYTFLARENAKMPARTIKLSYFEPNTEQYVPISLQIPAIEIAGGKVAGTEPLDKKEHLEEKTEKSANKKKTMVEDISHPILSSSKDFRTWLPYFNASLAALSIFIALGWVIKKESFLLKRSKGHIPGRFKQGDFSLGEFIKWLSPIIQKTGKSPSVIIKESDVDEDTKTYFIDLLSTNDYKDYSSRKTEAKFKYDPRHFKKLGCYIESITDDNSSQSS